MTLKIDEKSYFRHYPSGKIFFIKEFASIWIGRVWIFSLPLFVRDWKVPHVHELGLFILLHCIQFKNLIYILWHRNLRIFPCKSNITSVFVLFDFNVNWNRSLPGKEDATNSEYYNSSPARFTNFGLMIRWSRDHGTKILPETAYLSTFKLDALFLPCFSQLKK